MKMKREQKRKSRQRSKRQRRKRIKIWFRRIVLFILISAMTAGIVFAYNLLKEPRVQGMRASKFETHPAWEEEFLTVNEYSRPGSRLLKVDKLYVHYTANPGTNAHQNRSYFENLAETQETKASAHFIIGYEGEIVQCIPLDEIAYAVAGENHHSISIECCYVAEDGSFTKETYDSLITLLKWLCDAYHLEKEDILRHYDSNGKLCPLYYAEHEDAWEQLKNDVFSQ